MIVNIRAVFILPEALNTQVIAIWIHINQKDNDIICKNLAQPSITACSQGTKNQTKYLANINTIIQIIVRKTKERKELTLAISSALAIFFAPIFCHTNAAVDIDNHRDSIITNWTIFDQAQYDAAAVVQKLVIKIVKITNHKLRNDISIEEGNHKKKAVFIYEKSGLKLGIEIFIQYVHLNKKNKPIKVAIDWVNKVAKAAHETHIAGIIQYQNINRGSKNKFNITVNNTIFIGNLTSHIPLSNDWNIKNEKTKTIHKNEICKNFNASL